MNSSAYLIEGPVPASLTGAEIAGQQQKTAAGAVAVFLGQVRNDAIDGKTVSGIEYSAYDAMIDPVVTEIHEELFHDFSDLIFVKILHSNGLVKCGEVSLLVVVSSGHRKQAFAALEQCVERIKANLPVWKKELFTDGTSRWIS